MPQFAEREQASQPDCCGRRSGVVGEADRHIAGAAVKLAAAPASAARAESTRDSRENQKIRLSSSFRLTPGCFGFQKGETGSTSQLPLRRVPAPDTIGRLNLKPYFEDGRIIR
jgi:hypothetical protein